MGTERTEGDKRVLVFDLSLISFMFTVLFYHLWGEKLKGKKTESATETVWVHSGSWWKKTVLLNLAIYSGPSGIPFLVSSDVCGHAEDSLGGFPTWASWKTPDPFTFKSFSSLQEAAKSCVVTPLNTNVSPLCLCSRLLQPRTLWCGLDGAC